MRPGSALLQAVERMRARVPLDLGRVWQTARYRRLQKKLAGPRLIRAFTEAYPNAFFIEIGSNDGVQQDQLRPSILSHPWSGIMVEPVPYVFERLRANYGGLDRIVLENAAIADRDGSLPFYHLVEADPEESGALPAWYDGIGSFSRDAVLAHERHIPDLERRLVCAEVPTLKFESLCRRHRVTRLDLLLLDTEGRDWEIIRQIDLGRRRPRLLIYEHYHLTAHDRAACRGHLERLGYETMEEGFDTFCLQADVDDRLTQTWRGLRPAVRGVSAHEENP